MASSNNKVAVVGATGVIGREVLSALIQKDFTADQLTLLGSERSAGDEVEYGDDSLEVEQVTDESFRGVGVVILATPADVSRTLAPRAQLSGAWAVDLSEAFHADASVPLVLPPVNGQLLDSDFKGRILSVPGPIATALALIARPLPGLSRIHVTALLGASSAGDAGIRELEKQTAELLSGRETEASVFPHRLGMNFIPQVGELLANGDAAEEARWEAQTARLLPNRAFSLSGLAVQVPTFYGHGLSLLMEGSGLTAESAREALRQAPSIKVLDAPGERVYPMPMLVTADDAVHVGRIRSVPGRPDAVQLFAAIDNAGRGAAMTAVEIAERLPELTRPEPRGS